MTKKEMQRLSHQEDVLMSLGFTQGEAESLRRISMTLHRWHELECGIDGGCVEREEATGKAMWRSSMSGKAWPMADRETGAKKRLAYIVNARNARQQWAQVDGKIVWPHSVHTYIQGDPRGAALYILRPGDIPEGADVGAYYSRGICVY
jgi:hypothetical protein